MPVNNRWAPTSRALHEREVRRNKRIHHERLRKIKPSIDMKPPASLSMKRSGKKREQMIAEKQSNINYNNALLMDKILHVARRKNVYLAAGKPGAKTLNGTSRRQKSLKIQRENQRLLKTLINVQSQIKRNDLESTYLRHRALADKMRENSMNFYPTKEQKQQTRRQHAIRRLASAQGSRRGKNGGSSSPSPGGRRPKTAPGVSLKGGL